MNGIEFLGAPNQRPTPEQQEQIDAYNEGARIAQIESTRLQLRITIYAAAVLIDIKDQDGVSRGPDTLLRLTNRYVDAFIHDQFHKQE